MTRDFFGGCTESCGEADPVLGRWGRGLGPESTIWKSSIVFAFYPRLKGVTGLEWPESKNVPKLFPSLFQKKLQKLFPKSFPQIPTWKNVQIIMFQRIFLKIFQKCSKMCSKKCSTIFRKTKRMKSRAHDMSPPPLHEKYDSTTPAEFSGHFHEGRLELGFLP